MRKSGSKAKALPTSTDRKSVAGSSSTRKKKKAGLDEESKARIANIELKIEDLRKQSFGEINRLEAFIEKYKEDQLFQLNNLFDQLKTQ